MSTAITAAHAKTKGKRLLQDVLYAYKEDGDEGDICQWNKRKSDAIRNGKWKWREDIAEHRIPKRKVELNLVKIELASLLKTSDALNDVVHAKPTTLLPTDTEAASKTCNWRYAHYNHSDIGICIY